MHFKMCQSVLLCVTIVWCDFAVCRSLLRAGKWLSDYLTAYVTISQVHVLYSKCVTLIKFFFNHLNTRKKSPDLFAQFIHSHFKSI